MQKLTTFLMFEGNAEQAMNFYISLFDDSKVLSLTRFGADIPDMEGKIVHAVFALGSQEFMCVDSYVHHEFTFTPAMSIYVQCQTEAEVDRLFEQLSQAGKVLMPLDSYPFSPRFAWVQDRFGVSWQLSQQSST